MRKEIIAVIMYAALFALILHSGVNSGKDKIKLRARYIDKSD